MGIPPRLDAYIPRLPFKFEGLFGFADRLVKMGEIGQRLGDLARVRSLLIRCLFELFEKLGLQPLVANEQIGVPVCSAPNVSFAHGVRQCMQNPSCLRGLRSQMPRQPRHVQGGQLQQIGDPYPLTIKLH